MPNCALFPGIEAVHQAFHLGLARLEVGLVAQYRRDNKMPRLGQLR